MMMRLVDGHKRIDCVFELRGQYAHDAVPGLYIAVKAGALLFDPNGVRITDADLANKLMKPASNKPEDKLCYLLCATQELGQHLLSQMRMSMENPAERA